jgi:hypothetical protein
MQEKESEIVIACHDGWLKERVVAEKLMKVVILHDIE